MVTSVGSSGVASGIDWNSLIQAVLQQEGQSVQALQTKQTANNNRITALQSLQSDMSSLSSGLSSLAQKFDARTVASSDSSNKYVTATASGKVAGTYEVLVDTLATTGKIAPTLDSSGNPTNLAVAEPLTTPIFSGSSATFAIQGTDGVVKTLTLNSGNNTLYGLRDAINALGTSDSTTGAAGLGVVASVVNTGKGDNPYQLVLTAKTTGTGKTGGVVTIADITAGGAVNTLGIGAGSVDSASSPTSITGGLASSGSNVALDAKFSVNGIELTRKTNTVTDAVDGVTFSLQQGGQASPTVLTVATDTSSITSSMQDVITKFNTLLKDYQKASASGGALNNDTVARSFISRVRTALSGSPSGLSSNATFNSAASLGVRTNRDGSLSLDTTTFQKAIAEDPEAAKRVFANGGDSTNAALSFYGSGPKTTTGAVSFNITSYTAGGAVAGTFTVGGVDYTLTGSNGSLVGATGTPLEGLILSVSGTGSGTLTLSRGVGQAAQDAISSLTAYGSGTLNQVVTSIQAQNTNLARQITIGQERLDRRQVQLQAQFAQIESMIGQLQAAGQSLNGLR